MEVPADLDLHWSHTPKKAYIWRKGLIGAFHMGRLIWLYNVYKCDKL
jgi:hypothetical protein